MHHLPASFETIARCNVESHVYIAIPHYWVNFDHLRLIDFRFTSKKNQTQKPSKAGEAFRRQLADLQSLAKRAAAKPLRLAPAVFERKSFAWREAMADGMDG